MIHVLIFLSFSKPYLLFCIATLTNPTNITTIIIVIIIITPLSRLYVPLPPLQLQSHHLFY